MQRLCVADFKHPCLKLWAFNFGHPCPSLVKGEVLSPEKIRATTGGIASPLSLACTNPSKNRTITLASLVKGRWIDGKAQTVVLLRFNCDTSAFFIHQTFLPSRRRDCYTTPSKTALSLSLFVGEWACPSRCIEPLHPNNFLKSTSIALPRTTKLASLVKGEVLSPERIRTTTGGIATPLSPRPTPTLPKAALSLENR